MKSVLLKYQNLPITAKASLWFLLCSFLQKGIAVITTPIFTRLLTPSEYGQIAAFISWYSVIGVIVSLNLASGVYTAAMVKFKNERIVLASSYQGLTLFLCLLWLFIYLLFIDFWNELFSLTTAQMLAMLTMIWSSAAFSLWCIEQRVIYNYKKLVTITAVVSIVSPITGVVLVLFCEDKVTARILGMAVVNFIAYAGLSAWQMLRGKQLVSKRFWLYALQFNLPLVPHALSQTVLSSSDRIMIQNLVGNTEAGFYSLAYSISLIMIIFNTSISQSLAPWTYQKLKENRVEELNGVAVFTIGCVAILNFLLIIFAPEVICIFAPLEYLEAAYIIPPVAVSVYFMFLYDWFARFEYYYEKTKYILVASLIGAVSNVILNYIFIPKFGYMAAGYTTFVCYGIYCFMHYSFMSKICRINLPGRKVYNIKQILIISITLITCAFFVLFTYKSILIRYGICAVIIIIVLSKRVLVMMKIKELLYIRKIGGR